MLPLTVHREFSLLSYLLERKKEDGAAQSNQKREFRDSCKFQESFLAWEQGMISGKTAMLFSH